MCDGGGSGDGGAAARQAEAEEKRQRELQAALGAINTAFAPGGRAPLYNNLYGDVLDTHTADLNEQFGDAQRTAKFNLARRGMTGSSVDADSRSELSDRHNEAAIRAAQLAEQAKQGLIANDEQTRSRLVQQAYGGLGATSVAQQAYNQATVNAQQAAADSRLSNLGQVFADLTAVNLGANDIAGRTQARRLYEQQTGSYYPTARKTYAGEVS